MSRKKTYLDSGVLISAFQGIQSINIKGNQVNCSVLDYFDLLAIADIFRPFKNCDRQKQIYPKYF